MWHVRDCVKTAYLQRRTLWLARTRSAAAEEANRPILRHIYLQRCLRDLGLLAADATINGVYSAATRTAISKWQQAHSRDVTGILGDADAAALDADFRGQQSVGAAVTAPNPSTSINPPSSPATLPLVETPDNRALIHGDDDDILVLLNVGPAARIALNVRGEPVFPPGTLDICVLGGQSLPFDAVDAVESTVLVYGLRVDLSKSAACPSNMLDRADVLIGSRAALRRTDRVILDRLIADYVARKLDLRTIILASDLRTARDHRAEAARKNQAYLADPNAPGWGALLINNNSQRICGVSAPKSVADAVIDKSRRTLALEIGQRLQPGMQWMDADSAFIAARRSACRIIIGKATELAPFMAALDRDKISHSLSSEWIIPPPSSSKLVTSASSSLEVNDDNRWLVGGSPKDFLVLVQWGPAAPYASANSLGEPVFVNGKATICDVGKIDDPDALQQLTKTFKSYQLQMEVDKADMCNPVEISTYDLLFGTREDFLRLPRSAIDWLIDGTKNRNLAKPYRISADQLQRMREEREAAQANTEMRPANLGKPAVADDAVGGISIPTQLGALVVFLVIGCGAAYFTYRRFRHRKENVRLNEQELSVGAKGVVSLPIVNGQGKVRLGGRVWLADGPNLPAGTQVIVKSVHGMRITVETVNSNIPNV